MGAVCTRAEDVAIREEPTRPPPSEADDITTSPLRQPSHHLELATQEATVKAPSSTGKHAVSCPAAGSRRRSTESACSASERDVVELERTVDSFLREEQQRQSSLEERCSSSEANVQRDSGGRMGGSDGGREARAAAGARASLERRQQQQPQDTTMHDGEEAGAAAGASRAACCDGQGEGTAGQQCAEAAGGGGQSSSSSSQQPIESPFSAVSMQGGAGPTADAVACAAAAAAQRPITRTPSNASSVVSASHVAPSGLDAQAQQYGDGTTAAASASMRRKRPQLLLNSQAQAQGQKKQQPQGKAGYPMAPNPQRPAGAPARRTLDPVVRGRPGDPGSAYGPPRKPSKKFPPSGSGLSKATAFAAAAVVRSAPLPNYPNYPNYPKYPAPSSTASDESGLVPLYESPPESDKELDNSLDWSELSCSLPPSQFCTSRASRVLDNAEVQEILGQIGADATAAAHRLNELVDGQPYPRTSDSSGSGPAVRLPPSAYGRPHHHPGPSLHQHLYPGCPFPLTSGSQQQKQQQPSARALPAPTLSRLSAVPPSGGLVGEHSSVLCSVAEDSGTEDGGTPSGASAAATVTLGERPHAGKTTIGDDSAMLSQLSLSALPPCNSAHDTLGISDLSMLEVPGAK